MLRGKSWRRARMSTGITKAGACEHAPATATPYATTTPPHLPIFRALTSIQRTGNISRNFHQGGHITRRVHMNSNWHIKSKVSFNAGRATLEISSAEVLLFFLSRKTNFRSPCQQRNTRRSIPSQQSSWPLLRKKKYQNLLKYAAYWSRYETGYRGEKLADALDETRTVRTGAAGFKSM
jgi:hypothetical protein